MPQIRNELKDSVIVVLGASSGFGRGAATRLGKAGAKVILAARRDNLLEEIAEEIRAAGGDAAVVHCDVTVPEQVNDVKKTALERYGRIDVWLNIVGVGALGLFWDIPIEDQARVIDINLKGLLYGAHAAIQQFRGQGYGVLINVGSIDSEVPLAYQTTYAATKAAVLSMGRSLNEELRLRGEQDSIKVTTIMPWAVDTPWWIHAANYSGHQPRMAAMDDPSIVVDAIVKACTDPESEVPVGPKARASNASHHIFPDLTERLSAKIADREVKKASSLPETSGTLFHPMQEGATVEGGIRARMKEEDRPTRS